MIGRTVGRMLAFVHVLALVASRGLAADASEGVMRVIAATSAPNGAGTWTLHPGEGGPPPLTLEVAYGPDGRPAGTLLTPDGPVPLSVQATPTRRGIRVTLRSTDTSAASYRIEGTVDAVTGDFTGRARTPSFPAGVVATGTTPLLQGAPVAVRTDCTVAGGRVSGVASVSAFTGWHAGDLRVSGKTTTRHGVRRVRLDLHDAARRRVGTLKGVAAGGTFAGVATVRLPGVRARGGFEIRDGDAFADAPPVVAPPLGVEVLHLPGGRTVEAVRDELLVTLREDVSTEEVAGVIEAAGALGAALIGELPDARLLQFDVGPNVDESEAAAILAALPGVLHCGPNEILVSAGEPCEACNDRPRGEVPARSPRRTREAGVPPAQHPSFPGDWWIGAVDAAGAWEVAGRSSAPQGKIGIVDVGVPPDQDVFEPSRLTRLRVDGGAASEDGSHFDEEHGEHGLFTAGLAAAAMNRVTLKACGVAGRADVVAVDAFRVRCEGSPWGLRVSCRVSSADVAAATVTALDRGARVVNISVGPGGLSPMTPSADRLAAHRDFRARMTTLVAAAARRDALLVFASGNDREHADDCLLPAGSPADPTPWRTNAIIVGGAAAGGGPGNRAYYLDGTRGEVVDLVAPAEMVGFRDRFGDLVIDGPVTGTSYAAPLVTGTASLLWGIAPAFAAAEIRETIVETARAGEIQQSDAPSVLLDAGAAARTAEEMASVPLSGRSTTSGTHRGRARSPGARREERRGPSRAASDEQRRTRASQMG